MKNNFLVKEFCLEETKGDLLSAIITYWLIPSGKLDEMRINVEMRKLMALTKYKQIDTNVSLIVMVVRHLSGNCEHSFFIF